jgi:hypothetical protein
MCALVSGGVTFSRAIVLLLVIPITYPCLATPGKKYPSLGVQSPKAISGGLERQEDKSSEKPPVSMIDQEE